MTVLVVEEHEVDSVVTGRSGMIHIDVHGVRLSEVSEVVEVLHFLGNPSAEAFLGGSVDTAAHAVKALEDSEPHVAAVVVVVADVVPVHNIILVVEDGLEVGVHVRHVLGTNDGGEEDSGSESFHFQI